MIDRDLAELYQVETKRLNEQVKRNKNRFPIEFCFQLNDDEKNELVANCDRFSNLKHSTSNPYAFTEQGIAMLSAVLKSDAAVNMSIKIMNTFVEMRNYLLANEGMLSRIDRVERKQLETDKKLEEILYYMDSNADVKQKVFFDGQIYDAFSFIASLIQKSDKKIILIDNYVDLATLNILSKKKKDVDVTIITGGNGKLSNKDVEVFNSQYPTLSIKKSKDFHDRFLIIDDKQAYHIGASIKDAGKKSFGITKIEDKDITKSIINKLM